MLQGMGHCLQATLEEVVEADLLLHVIDASSPNVDVQRDAVYKVLKQLGIKDARLQERVLEVWNKSDLIDPSEAYREAAEMSAAQAKGIEASSQSSASAENQPGVLSASPQEGDGLTCMQDACLDSSNAEPADSGLDLWRRQGSSCTSSGQARKTDLGVRGFSSSKEPGRALESAQQDAIWQLIQVREPNLTDSDLHCCGP